MDTYLKYGSGVEFLQVVTPRFSRSEVHFVPGENDGSTRSAASPSKIHFIIDSYVTNDLLCNL